MQTLIYVVDDDLVMRTLFSTILSDTGSYDVKSFESASIALNAIEQGEIPQLIILDLMMQGMDGLEVLRLLAELNYKGRILLASGVDSRILDAAFAQSVKLQLNVVGQLAKPFDANKLLGSIDSVVPYNSESSPLYEKCTIDDLADAIGKGGIKVRYQPQVNLQTGELAGFEAIAVWQHAHFGEVPAEFFIAMAEREGEIYTLTLRLLNQISMEMNAIREMNVLVPFSLNISPKLLTRAKLPDKIEEILKNNDLKNDAIIVEISETSALRDDAQTLEVLSRLRMKGMGVAIDDFGVGYSNSQQLLSLPFSQMKVDRHFVHLAEKDKVAQLAIEYDYQLAQKLKVEIVFDGVNDEHCFACLINFPHAIVQGDALAASMNLDELLNWCDGWLTCEQKNWLDKITQMATL